MISGATAEKPQKLSCCHGKLNGKQPLFQDERLGSSANKMADSHDDFLKKIVARFPSGISLAFAYGSGIFSQKGNVSSKNMLDFVFVLEDADQWHKTNLNLHSHHYSFVGRFGSNAVVSLQDRFGARMYYNTLVPMEGRVIKYGTISRENFLLDLNEWQWLYLSGRLHKPVKILHRGDDADILSALKGNLYSAVNVALLSLPEFFTEEELFSSIAGLSFAGDFRMIVGENKNKVQNIVGPNIEPFRDLYNPILLKSNEIHFNSSSRKYHQNQEINVIFSRLKSLPRNLLQYVVSSVISKEVKASLIEETLYDTSKDIVNCSQVVRKGITSIVRKSSISQSIKGVITAGGHKTLIYSAQKINKMLKGIFRG